MDRVSKPMDSLVNLPLLPRDDKGPVFAEPWQAQAFATVVELIESGRLTSKEWAECLGATIREAEERGDVDTGLHYYELWLTALERLAVEKNFAAWDDLATERETIRSGDHHRRSEQLGHSHEHHEHHEH